MAVGSTEARTAQYRPAATYPFVSSTLELLNKTVYSGNYIPTNGGEPGFGAYDPVTGDVYILTYGDYGILPINATTYRWTGGTRLGFDPAQILYDPEDKELYVANADSDNVSIFNPVTLAQLGQVIVGNCPDGMVYDQARHALYVANECSGTLSVLNASTNALEATWAVGGDPGFEALDPVHGTVYVANYNDTVAILNTTTGKLDAVDGMGTYVSEVAVDPAIGRAFVSTDSNLTIINTTTYATNGLISTDGFWGVTVDSQNHRLFVPEVYGVYVYSTSTLSEIGIVPSGEFGSDPVYYQHQSQVWVSYGEYGNVSVINASTDKVQVASITLGTTPEGVVAAPMGGNLFVANYAGFNVSQVNLTTGTEVAWQGPFSYPGDEILNPNTDQIYLSAEYPGTADNLVILNGATGSMVGGKDLPGGSGYMAYDPSNLDLYTVDSGYPTSTVYVYNTTTWSTVATMVVGPEGSGIAYDPSVGEVFVSQQYYGNVTVINASKQAIVATIPTGSFGTASMTVDPTSGQVFVANFPYGKVYVISVASNTITNTISINDPEAILYDVGNNLVFVANGEGDTVSAINPTSLAVTSVLDVGLDPLYLSDDPALGTVYVSDEYSGTVTTINTGPSVPEVTAFTASLPTLDIGQSTTMKVSVVFGTPPYTYAYSSLPSGCISANTSALVCTPTAAGTSKVKVTVTDNLKNSATASLSLHVNIAPVVTSFTATPMNLTIGTSTLLKVVGSGGTGNYSYSYTGLPPGCAGTNTPTLICTPTSAGYYSVNVTLRDTLGVSSTASVTVTVNVVPYFLTFVAMPRSIDNGSRTQFNASVAGGTGPISYNYSGLPPGCANQNVSLLNCTPTTVGNYTVRVVATDAVGVSAAAFTELAVNPALVLKSASATPASIPLGNATMFSIVVSGGAAPVTYSYSGLPGGCNSANSPTLYCLPSTVGNFSVTLKAADSGGKSVSATVALTVTAITAPLAVSLAVTPQAVDVGVGVQFKASVVNASGTYTYVYAGLPHGCQTQSTGTLQCTPSSAGNYTVSVTVEGSGGAKGHASCLLVVNKDLTLVSATATPSNITEGNSSVLSITVSGGTMPYAYSYSNLPAGCASTDSPALACSPTETGNFTVTLQANDSGGQWVSGQVTFQVSVTSHILPPPPHTKYVNNTQSPSWLTYALVALIVVLAVGLTVVILYRRRGDGSTPRGGPPPAAAAPQPPASAGPAPAPPPVLWSGTPPEAPPSPPQPKV